MGNQSNHLAKVAEAWDLLQKRIDAGSYVLNGQDLHISDVVATALHGCIPQITDDPKVVKSIQDSVDVLYHYLSKGWYVYGVNTGFGGSADTRTDQVVALQSSLMQLTQSGIISRHADGSKPGHSMPAEWVKAAIVVRCNSTLRGHSAVSLPILKAITDLLENDLTPVVPLRGSVSSSGDLMPLSYVAGSIEGNPDVLIEKNGKVLPAPQALAEAGLQPVKLGPKEGLGLINGTSSSAALASIVITESHRLALLTQALTGMAVEALHGSRESFNPFIAKTRPHPGQIEVARNIYYFMRDSALARDVLEPKNRRSEDLVQDRYSVRSAPQWIGPQIEDLLLADQQISIELNSSCDNPLVDVETKDIHYGCNFQAASITSSMEKVRLSLQMFGRMLFSQLTEMVDPSLSGGLPANLAADDPSLSFTFKGVEINMASYMAELSYYAGPMSPFIQAAEMHNQSVNSMALASARMSAHATEILTMMTAAHLYASCQGVDLRALHMHFVKKAIETLSSVTTQCFSGSLASEELETFQKAIAAHVYPSWSSSSKKDLADRCESLVSTAVPIVVSHTKGSVEDVTQWKEQAIEAVKALWKKTFDDFCAKPHTPTVLGKGSKVLYQYVREELGVPFHQGFVEHPTNKVDSFNGRPKRTIGGWISIVHDAIKGGSLYGPLIALASEGLLSETNGNTNGYTNGHTNGQANGYTNGYTNGAH
ncbi:phenylalanine ammonia-lyase [Annulohypoxylon truncatum]|uniref:phenylalanine ammonia-lyase n=1 Tax=Annulohypoxylon truncatum TaxID=327061 RepID=UPI002008EB14|nr:phenylalanine ammonia-lyase [Annulohypoxylon truncatum]KAI1209036.1 phenylalanine ammonia-lyase [Annulohypoxylon truncatum]